MGYEQHLNEDAYSIEWRVEQAEVHLKRWVESRGGALPKR
jgi:hypothetical protein